MFVIYGLRSIFTSDGQLLKWNLFACGKLLRLSLTWCAFSYTAKVRKPTSARKESNVNLIPGSDWQLRLARWQTGMSEGQRTIRVISMNRRLENAEKLCKDQWMLAGWSGDRKLARSRYFRLIGRCAPVFI